MVVELLLAKVYISREVIFDISISGDIDALSSRGFGLLISYRIVTKASRAIPRYGAFSYRYHLRALCNPASY
jgi:hypothetical protein